MRRIPAGMLMNPVVISEEQVFNRRYYRIKLRIIFLSPSGQGYRLSSSLHAGAVMVQIRYNSMEIIYAIDKNHLIYGTA
jgi:hypothetical protein